MAEIHPVLVVGPVRKHLLSALEVYIFVSLSKTVPVEEVQWVNEVCRGYFKNAVDNPLPIAAGTLPSR